MGGCTRIPPLAPTEGKIYHAAKVLARVVEARKRMSVPERRRMAWQLHDALRAYRAALIAAGMPPPLPGE